ncbi:MAG: hypothetical protein ACOH2R_10770 [Pseudomonas sp.]
MSIADRLRFIESCELADCTHSLEDHVSNQNSRKKRSINEPTPPTAVVAGGTLLSYSEGMSAQVRQDIANSTLYAELVANKKYSQQSQVEDWYSLYNRVLTKVGWRTLQWSFGQYKATQRSFSMDEVGLKIIASAVGALALPGPARLAMIQLATEAVTALKAREEPLRLFEKDTKMHRGGSFRFGTANESADGTVTIALGAVNFKTQSDVTDVLFTKWNSASVEIYRGEKGMELVPGVYEFVREKILAELGKNALDALAEFDI